MNYLKRTRLTGLIAAPHTPLHGDGSLNLSAAERQAEHFASSGIKTVFVGGTTGECHSLSLQERRDLVQRWLEIGRDGSVQVIVHVGSNCSDDARDLARLAARAGAIGVATVAPCYFKPADTAALVNWCKNIASAVPETPFFYYDIPLFTGVRLPMPEFLAQAREHIQSLAGIKFTNPDLLSYQECIRTWGEDLDILWGLDELLLGALVFGCKGAVGATYNFAAPLYRRLIAAFEKGNLETARHEQFRSVQFIKACNRYGFFGATKAIMKMVGVDVGPARLPNTTLSTEQSAELQLDLEKLGFFDWIKR